MFERSNTTTLIGIVVPLKIVDISIFVNPLLLRFLPNTQKHMLVWSFQCHFFFNSNMLAKLHILSMTLVLYWSWGMYNKEAKSIISSQHMCNHCDSYINMWHVDNQSRPQGRSQLCVQLLQRNLDVIMN